MCSACRIHSFLSNEYDIRNKEHMHWQLKHQLYLSYDHHNAAGTARTQIIGNVSLNSNSHASTIKQRYQYIHNHTSHCWSENKIRSWPLECELRWNPCTDHLLGRSGFQTWHLCAWGRKAGARSWFDLSLYTAPTLDILWRLPPDCLGRVRFSFFGCVIRLKCERSKCQLAETNSLWLEAMGTLPLESDWTTLSTGKGWMVIDRRSYEIPADMLLWQLENYRQKVRPTSEI
jgi:hypothetical protein